MEVKDYLGALPTFWASEGGRKSGILPKRDHPLLDEVDGSSQLRNQDAAPQVLYRDLAAMLISE
jgi:hypothetical protein